jgi:hypothetical protein
LTEASGIFDMRERSSPLDQLLVAHHTKCR